MNYCMNSYYNHVTHHQFFRDIDMHFNLKISVSRNVRSGTNLGAYTIIS